MLSHKYPWLLTYNPSSTSPIVIKIYFSTPKPHLPKSAYHDFDGNPFTLYSRILYKNDVGTIKILSKIQIGFNGTIGLSTYFFRNLGRMVGP